MEPLAFVEVLDRHRDVIARHAIRRWPARIGRGYDADVILDDPYVAPLHASLEPGEDGRFRVVDLGSVNGILEPGAKERVDRVEVGPDDIVRLGHTHLRVRSPAYSVPQERPFKTAALYRRPSAFFVAAALMIALVLWNTWIVTTDEDDRSTMFFVTAGMVVLVGGWIAVWSFVSHAIGRRPNFYAHGVVACVGFIALIASDAVFEYAAFAFDAGWLGYGGGVAAGAILAFIVYRHLVLNSRARRKSLALASIGSSLGVCGALVAMSVASELSQEGNLRYNDAIKPPGLLWVSGVSPEAFFRDAQALKSKVDAMRKPAP